VTSAEAVNATQFHDFAGGPAEASARSLGVREDLYKKEPQGEQGQLFAKESVPLPEAHQQTPEQFARDPRTWWHGRVTKGGPQGRLGGSGVGSGEGFHVGSEAAARQRVTTNVKSRGLKEGLVGRMYPLRITGPVEGPENLQPDVTKHFELGPASYRYGQRVGGRRTGYLYKNVVEGGEREVSAGVPQRKGFLSTQREMVQAAKKEGRYVHPNIEWAVKNQPEHTAEKIQPRFHHQTPEGERYAPQKLPGIEAPNAEPIERHSYKTEEGGTQHIWRYTDQGTLGKQFGRTWERGDYRPPPAQYGPASGQSTKDWQHDVFSP
jgi:hypothetical protein